MSFLRICTGAARAIARPLPGGASRQLPRRLGYSLSQQCRFQTTGAHSASTSTQSKLTAPERFTTDSYPNLKRDPKFAQITEDDIAHFKSILPHRSSILTTTGAHANATPDDLEPFNTDWMRKYRGHTTLVLKPRTTTEASQILSYCNFRSLAVVPQGGNTGLVGGSIPVFDEIIISMNNFNQIRSFDPVSGILVCDAGVVLEVADQYLREQGHIFPLDLGAKGSCHVGGNVATNAGGLRLLRYGSLHGTVLGVEAVLPDGRIVNDLSTLRKNNTGYDLKQLFIGSEGTIGLITAISIQCPQKPTAHNVALFGLQSFDHVRQAFVKTKQQLSEILSAFELMDGNSQDLVAKVTGKKHPLESKCPFYVLIETSGSNDDHDAAKLDSLLEDLTTSEIISDGTQASNDTEFKGLWSWREGVPECLGHWGGVYKYDVSIPLAEFYDLVTATRKRCIEAGILGDRPEHLVVDVVGYGHVGDCNLHLNVPVRAYDKKVEQVLEPFIYEWIQERSGSISAEHGLGLAKKAYVGYSREPAMLKLMRDIKKQYDPKGIMNPYKYVEE
ncbi:hypothetical protein L211DRAFT_597904 [Terfezia boudieri ATCC MYA-4762]|uniref:D-2-hydroxyglutarate dehydrogenase, mitochondrial n=1 Tax=Terfezia boudieri ATCC MYA-4762 TaxID=1051890 RepID=A0A3N4LZF2_9PEZI|nr:hypothetical protein L211DRAFT_597904 [Terfezia boudieri ATCC MYA-4762]